MSDVATRVKNVIAEELGAEVALLSPATRLREDLGLSDGDLSYLLAEVESEFDIVLDADDGAEASTVGRMIRLVEKHAASFDRRRRR